VIERRRRPRFEAFIGTGVVLGFLAGSGLSLVREEAPGYSAGTAAAYLGLMGACLFGLLGAVLAVLLDRRR
jgi:hypothetical protein